MRRFFTAVALGVLLSGASCGSVDTTETGDPEALEVVDVKALERAYDAQRYWDFWQADTEKFFEALGANLHNLHMTIDRYFFNMDWDR
ncbi:MAG: hypothetical protein ACE5F1_15255 [Planctomycetota bacterium]